MLDKIGIFNKSFSELANAMQIQGVDENLGTKFRHLINSFSISKKDLENIEEYNKLVSEKGISSQTAWYKTMQSSSSSTI